MVIIHLYPIDYVGKKEKGESRMTRFGNRAGRALAVLAVMAVAAVGRTGSGAAAGFPPSADLKPGEIAVTGAVNVTFKPLRTEAGRLAGKIVVNLHEQIWGGVWIQFPAETGPGTYAIGDHLNNPGVGILADYDVLGANRANY
jgi:hypothetical protein